MAACIDAKEQGNALFGTGQYDEALTVYQRGIESTSPADADVLSVLLSNASACCAKLGRAEEALKYANQCVEAKKTWDKGYSRQAMAHLLLHRPGFAERALLRGLAECAGSKALREELKLLWQVRLGGSGRRGRGSGDGSAGSGDLLLQDEDDQHGHG